MSHILKKCIVNEIDIDYHHLCPHDISNTLKSFITAIFKIILNKYSIIINEEINKQKKSCQKAN